MENRTTDKADRTTLAPDSVVIGVIVGVDDESAPSVSFPGCPSEKGTVARTTVAFSQSDLGQQVALLFEAGDMRKPVVISKIAVPNRTTRETPPSPPTIETTIDGERLVLTGDKEIVLRCGKASITLTRAGKIIIRGAYLLNRSSGLNKIKGASVQIN